MEFIYNDGGRSKYFKAVKVNDCVTRAIANATGKDYKEVYDLVNSYISKERVRGSIRSNARDGVPKETVYQILTDMGWIWVPTMFIGKGCQVHLDEKELPKGTLLVSVSKHLTCVKDGKLYDTYDCTRGGTRCVYGYFVKEEK